MSRLIHFIARLYPRSWRQRYGAEFDALLEDVRPDGRTAADVFIGALAMQARTWKSWRILGASALFGVAVIAGGFIAAPNLYRSTALLKFGRQVSTSDKKNAVNILLAGVEGVAWLRELITADNLYLNERSTMTLGDVIQRMRKHIHVVAPVAPNVADFAVTFDYTDARVARKVTQDLASLFAEEVQNADGGLKVLDPASLPAHSLRSDRNIIALGFACFLLMSGALSGLRWIAVRRPT